MSSSFLNLFFTATNNELIVKTKNNELIVKTNIVHSEKLVKYS